MERLMLRSKIRGTTLTETQLHYEGSVTVDRDLLEASDILSGEQVHVLNLNNGERIITYAIEGPAGSGMLMLNGPAARLGMVGDPVMVLSYVMLSDEEARSWQPRIIHAGERNRLIEG